MAEVDNICGKISRVILVIINLLLAVIGIATVALGSYVVHIARTQGGISVVLAGGAVLIAGGIIVILVTSAGTYGAVSLSKIMLGIYIFCVVIIIILEVVGAILGFVFRGRIVQFAGDVYLRGINEYRPTNDSQFNKNTNNMIDSLQNHAKCCGWNDTTGNWEGSPFFKATNRFPESCGCPSNTTANCVKANNNQNIWNSTCQASVTNVLKKNLGIIGGVGAAIAVIQIFPLLLAIILMCTISSDDYKQV